jgi:hypothetical protein
MEAAQARRDHPERPFVHVEDPAPGDAARIDVERVLPVHVVVDHRGQQVVGRANRMEVAGKMQVDVRHRNHLRETTAGSATLHAETGPEARFAQADDRILANSVQAVTQADGCRCLAFTRRRWRNGGHKDELAVAPVIERIEKIVADLGLVVAIGNDVVGF